MTTGAAVLVAFLAVPVPHAAAASSTVAVGDDAFSPATLDVTTGDAITWTFSGAGEHSVTADGGSFDSHPACSAADTKKCGTAGSPAFTHTFTTAGSFPYHCRVHGSAMSGTVVVTDPDTTPPPAVSGLAAKPADGQVTLSWTPPADADFRGVVVRRSADATPPASPTDGVSVYSGTGRTVTVTGLANGTSYGFSVFTRDEVPNWSAPASAVATPVPALAVSLTMARTASTVGYGRTVTLTGTLKRSDTGAGLSGEKLEVWGQRFGTTGWRRYAVVTTGTGGVARWTTRPGASAWWVLRHAKTPYYGEVQTSPAAVQVRLALAVRPSAAAIETGQVASYAVTVAPNHAGRVVQLQQYRSGAWKSIAGIKLSTSSTATFRVKPTALGSYYYRVYMPGDVDHLGRVSGTYKLTVVRRTLRPGMSGTDVLDVERRLAAMRYDVGAVDGYFNYDTTHAVAAFQKVNGIARTSIVDATTWSRLLGKPVRPTMREYRTGSWVEIDLRKQVLYFGRNGALFRVVDISSGSGQLYTVDGITERAITPTGRFRIERKINAWRTSRLGQLYRPAYFVRGYAVHGSYSVPTYPASHGCVRTTLAAMDRLYDMYVVGTPVWIYYS